MVKIQNKLDKASQCLEYFTGQEWRFSDENVKHLNSILSNEDRRTFHFDVRDIDWPRYLEDYILGIRSFIFKEDPTTLPTARKQVQRFVTFRSISLSLSFDTNLIFFLSQQIVLDPPVYSTCGSRPSLENVLHEIIARKAGLVFPNRHSPSYVPDDTLFLTQIHSYIPRD